MYLVRTPVGLRYSSFALFFSIPLALLQVIFIKKAAWWNLPYPTLMTLGCLTTGINLLLFYGLRKARSWALPITLTLGSLWFIGSMGFALYEQRPSLIFFCFFLLAFLLAEIFWLHREIKKIYIHSQLFWYQGLPQPIADIYCQIKTTPPLCLKVAKLNKEGCLIFQKNSLNDLKFLSKQKKLNFIFNFREKTITYPGKIITLSCQEKVLGVQWLPVSLEENQKMLDFLEKLRTEGRI